jgi:hypothetical protein
MPSVADLREKRANQERLIVNLKALRSKCSSDITHATLEARIASLSGASATLEKIIEARSKSGSGK